MKRNVTLVVLLLAATQACGKSGSPGTEMNRNDGVIIVSGIFDHAGETLLSLKPVRRHAWRAGTLPDQKAGRFQVRVKYAGGEEQIVPFDALVADDAGRTRHGFFEVTIPVSGELESVSITDSSGRKQFAVIQASEIHP